MVINRTNVYPGALRVTTVTSQILGQLGETNCVMFVPLLEWVISPKLYNSNLPLNDEYAMIYHARNRKAMIKGLRKVHEMVGDEKKYMLDGEGENIGMVFAKYHRQVSTTRVGSGLRIVGHNVAQAGKRFLANTAIGTSYLFKYAKYKNSDQTTRQFRESINNTVQKVGNAVGIDRYQSFDSISNMVNEFQSGFYLFIARSKYLPLKAAEDARVVRMIGSKANFGSIARHLENPGSNSTSDLLGAAPDFDEI